MGRCRTLHPGAGRGRALILGEPLSLWGGLDSGTGVIIDAHHPQAGACLTGRVLVMPAGRGSSSSSSTLVEAMRRGTAPAAIILRHADPILAIGALVAAELYQKFLPIVTLEAAAYDALRDGDCLEVTAGEEEARLTVLAGE
jgi:predicted aconitase with swiveling domain